MQAYCTYRGLECVYRPRRKPGPSAHAFQPGRGRRAEDEAEYSVSSVGSSPSLPGALQAQGDGGASGRDISVPVSIHGAATEPEFQRAQHLSPVPNSLPTVVNPVQPLPPQELLNYLMSVYMHQLYPTNPLTIKPELLRELATPGEVPDFYIASIALWAARWDPRVAFMVAREPELSLVFRSLYSRLKASLLPALDFVLMGPEAVRGRTERKRYFRTATRVLLALFHLAGIAVTYPTKTEGTFESFQSAVGMALAVVKAAKLQAERLYGSYVPAISALHSGEYYSADVERFRRAWWAFVAFDYMQSTMYNRDPVLPWADPGQLRPPKSSDEDFEAVKQFLLDGSDATDDWSPESTSDPTFASHQWPFISAGNLSVAQPTLLLDDVFLTAPLQSAIINGKLVFYFVALRLAQLGSLVAKYRRMVPKPYLDRPGRAHLGAQVEHCLSELPQFLITDLPEKLDAIKHLLGTDLGVAPVHGAHYMLFYLGIMCLLNSPAEACLWNGEMDTDWLESPAFLRAQEYAVKATEILTPLVEAPGTAPQMCLPFFQYCVIRTGVMHLAFLRAAQLAGKMDSQQAAVARAQIAIHTAALRKAQGGLGAEQKSWWFEAWSSVVGL